MRDVSLDDFEKLNRDFESLTPIQRIQRGYEVFGYEQVVFSSSFGALSAGLCHLVSQAAPGTIVYFLDTGFHFPETLAFRDKLMERLPLKLEIITPALSKQALFEQLGQDPYLTDPDACCHINKVMPMQAVLENKKAENKRAWISGLRRGQNAFRTALDFLMEGKDGHYKIHPILDWSQKDLYDYIVSHELPLHPLWEKGYASIGCAPCTQPCTDPEDERHGRWAGNTKTECGLHQ